MSSMVMLFLHSMLSHQGATAMKSHWLLVSNPSQLEQRQQECLRVCVCPAVCDAGRQHNWLTGLFCRHAVQCPACALVQTSTPAEVACAVKAA